MPPNQMANARVLIVEDSNDDFFLLDRAMAKIDSRLSVTRARDGIEALRVLDSLVGAGDQVPIHVLLDLRLPGSTGLELLAQIRSHPKLGATQIVVFSGSRNPVDFARAYQLGATACIAKPDHYDELVVLLRVLVQFWLSRGARTDILAPWALPSTSLNQSSPSA